MLSKIRSGFDCFDEATADGCRTPGRNPSSTATNSRASGKPDNIIEKMIEGRIRKFLEEIVLLDQIFVIDGKSKITEVVANASKELGAPVVLASYARFELGEGIEKEVINFADEVAAVAKS
jgi:elongation factor Ts